MENKPIIRHCRNCKWCQKYPLCDSIECNVTYKRIWYQRITAIFCKYYKKKEDNNGKC